MTTMRVVGECFFWYRLTRVFPDKFHRAVKRLCVCVCVCCTLYAWLDNIYLDQQLIANNLLESVTLYNKPSPKSFWKSCITTPHGREWICQLHVLTMHCPLQTRPVTQMLIRYIHTTRTYDDGICRASIASCNKNTLNLSPWYHWVICKELHSHPSRKEWTCPLHAQCPLQTSPITQLWVWYIHTATPMPQRLAYLLQSCCDAWFFSRKSLNYYILADFS